MILVKFDKEVKGTSSVKGHKDWIVFDSYAFNGARYVNVQGDQRDIGPAYISDFMLTKTADLTSPELFVSTMTGDRFTSVTIVLMRTAGTDSEPQKLVEIKLAHPIITGFSSCCQGDDRPKENLSLSFASIDYKFFNIDGGVAGGYTNKVYSVIKEKKD